MADLPSRLDLYALARSYLLSRATRIDPTKVDVVGSDANLFLGTQSVVSFSIVRQLAYRTNALLLTGATGQDLDRLGYDRYQEPRKGASSALVNLAFARPTAALGGGTIPVGTLVQTGTGVQYVTTAPATFTALQTTGATATAQATQAGKTPQVAANQLTQFVNQAALFDPTITVNNPAAAAGGEPTEDDDTYRNRLLSFWQAARRGTLAAIEFGALTVPGVVSANAVEALNPFGQPARVVVLYIADSSGVASQALADQVNVVLNDYRAAGIAVIIATSIPQLVSITLSLTFLAGTDTAAVSQLVQAAVVGFVNSLPVNGPLLLLQLGAILQRFASQGVVPTLSSIVIPTGDLIPSVGQTLRTTLTLVQVAPAA